MILSGKDVMAEKLETRRRLLETRVLPKLDEPIRYSTALEASLPNLIRSVKAHGFEGLVAKRLSSRYEPGLRTGSWTKMRVNQGHFVVSSAFRRFAHRLPAVENPSSSTSGGGSGIVGPGSAQRSMISITKSPFAFLPDAFGIGAEAVKAVLAGALPARARLGSALVTYAGHKEALCELECASQAIAAASAESGDQRVIDRKCSGSSGGWFKAPFSSLQNFPVRARLETELKKMKCLREPSVCGETSSLDHTFTLEPHRFTREQRRDVSDPTNRSLWEFGPVTDAGGQREGDSNTFRNSARVTPTTGVQPMATPPRHKTRLQCSIELFHVTLEVLEQIHHAVHLLAKD